MGIIDKFGISVPTYNKGGVDAAREQQDLAKNQLAATPKNIDKADFSAVLRKQRNPEKLEKLREEAKATIKGKLAADAEPDRIETLKQMIQKQTYNISPELVACAIFS